VTGETLLDVRDLHTSFRTDDGIVRAVDGVSFSLAKGRTLGIVGESGSGKSATCLSLMGLHAARTTTVSGEAIFKGRDLLALSPRELRAVRGNEIAMIFQDPLTALNPVTRIGKQLVEAVRLHQDVSARAARARALALLQAVGISQAERRMDDYPHQFSGGMRQRVMIAMALVNDPDLLIADEPTTALDVTTQAQILTLLARLRSEVGSAIILISHDLGVVAEVADEVLVMYAAGIVEQGDVGAVFGAPRHPYTWGLLGSRPRLDRNVARLAQIAGMQPSLLAPPAGCRFHPRCPHAFDACLAERPPLRAAPGDPSHADACLLDEATKAREGRRAVAGPVAEAS
jgi:oligopeptide/dipeptide ABC transporter ATP-binding protein